jgi:hypothetical protein
LQTNNILSVNQFGFLKGRNTTSQLLLCITEWLSAKESDEQVDCVYIDFAKAFDVVNHRFLIHKLRNYGISNNMLRWIDSYLSDRTFQVKYLSTLSNVYPCVSGVPQGSVLGPLLFLVYINDIEKCSLGHSSIVMYADDVKISRIMHSSDPVAAWVNFQNELKNISDWAATWLMTISESKCQHISTSSAMNFPLRLNGTLIPEVSDSVRDLGVLFSPDLTFTSHIKKIVVSATRVSNRILRSLVRPSLDVYRSAFISYCRPLLEYATVIWSPYIQSEIDLLENVQRRFTKRALNKIDYNLYNTKSYDERLLIFNIDSLQHRRIMFDLVECYKIVHGFHSHPSFSKMFHINSRPRRNGNSLSIIQESIASNQVLFSFKPRVTRIWNLLPDEVVQASSVDSFKKNVDSLKLVELYETSVRNTRF